jgi:cytochrome c oxidase assembly protein Cox11
VALVNAPVDPIIQSIRQQTGGVPREAESVARVVVRGIDIPLLDIFVLLLKVAIASVPLYLLAWMLLKLAA